MFANNEARYYQTGVDESQNQPCVSEMKCRFRQNRFTREQWIGNLARDVNSPVVVLIVPIPKRNQEAGIRDALHFLEKPLRDDRLAGPATFPANRRKGRPSWSRAFS